MNCRLSFRKNVELIESRCMTAHSLNSSMNCSFFVEDFLQDSLIRIRNKLVAITLKELILELNPMKTDGMQEAL